MQVVTRDVPLAKNPSTGTAQQRLFLVLKVVFHAVVVISEVLRLSTKSRCSRCCRHISTGNYISAQECTTRRIKIEKEQGGKKLTMANGSSVKTLGRVRLDVQYGGYQAIVETRVFPQMTKPMILGMPWLVKENPHINWTRSIVVVQQRILLIVAAKLLNRGSQVTESRQPNY